MTKGCLDFCVVRVGLRSFIEEHFGSLIAEDESRVAFSSIGSTSLARFVCWISFVYPLFVCM